MSSRWKYSCTVYDQLSFSRSLGQLTQSRQQGKSPHSLVDFAPGASRSTVGTSGIGTAVSGCWLCDVIGGSAGARSSYISCSREISGASSDPAGAVKLDTADRAKDQPFDSAEVAWLHAVDAVRSAGMRCGSCHELCGEEARFWWSWAPRRSIRGRTVTCCVSINFVGIKLKYWV